MHSKLTSVGESDCIPNNKKCPCSSERSQIASRCFVAPKKAPNAHGGEHDCRPSLKIQSCLCSAMKNHSASPSLSPTSACLACFTKATHPAPLKTIQSRQGQKIDKPFNTIWSPLVHFNCKHLTITPLKTDCLLFVQQWFIFFTSAALCDN